MRGASRLSLFPSIELILPWRPETIHCTSSPLTTGIEPLDSLFFERLPAVVVRSEWLPPARWLFSDFYLGLLLRQSVSRTAFKI
jgi:hypothetical protein